VGCGNEGTFLSSIWLAKEMGLVNITTELIFIETEEHERSKLIRINFSYPSRCTWNEHTCTHNKIYVEKSIISDVCLGEIN
jgi:hypothetical protein